ncbi:hypothetical protein [Niveibacterium microcysteis]|uniref:Actin-like protein N-terminal domain-containing protein n=1 Tax=Niveibacterium microcysteis TaxID=2811415 RepID=A0ABX7M8W5_9RHOO|nr:hypothetical protein [Niveibacterium microcysteis]QSI78189.1 hypothetical protein JY500_06005 [Niveibacterium microcysteis]
MLVESIVADDDESNDRVDGFHWDSCAIFAVGEQTFAVGAGARKLLTGNSTCKTFNPDFCTTEHYRALVYAAMAAQSSNRIDVLVLGLPVHTFELYRDRLIEDFTGERQITATRKVTVQPLKVGPQPMGGFYDHAERVTYEEVKMARMLTIAPGHNTRDGYCTVGARPMDTRRTRNRLPACRAYKRAREEGNACSAKAHHSKIDSAP